MTTKRSTFLAAAILSAAFPAGAVDYACPQMEFDNGNGSSDYFAELYLETCDSDLEDFTFFTSDPGLVCPASPCAGNIGACVELNVAGKSGGAKAAPSARDPFPGLKGPAPGDDDWDASERIKSPSRALVRELSRDLIGVVLPGETAVREARLIRYRYPVVDQNGNYVPKMLWVAFETVDPDQDPPAGKIYRGAEVRQIGTGRAYLLGKGMGRKEIVFLAVKP